MRGSGLRMQAGGLGGTGVAMRSARAHLSQVSNEDKVLRRITADMPAKTAAETAMRRVECGARFESKLSCSLRLAEAIGFVGVMFLSIRLVLEFIHLRKLIPISSTHCYWSRFSRRVFLLLLLRFVYLLCLFFRVVQVLSHVLFVSLSGKFSFSTYSLVNTKITSGGHR